MKNSLCLGAAVAAVALMEVTDNSVAADPGSYGRMIQKARENREAEQQTQEFSEALSPDFVSQHIRNLVQVSYRAGVVVGKNGCPDNPLAPELGRELTGLTMKNVDLQKELDATRAQVADLVKRLEIMEETCTDAIAEDETEDGLNDDFGFDFNWEYQR